MFLELRLESYREVPVEQVTSRHRVHVLEERIMLGVEFGRYDELLTPSNNQFYKIMQQGDH